MLLGDLTTIVGRSLLRFARKDNPLYWCLGVWNLYERHLEYAKDCVM